MNRGPLLSGAMLFPELSQISRNFEFLTGTFQFFQKTLDSRVLGDSKLQNHFEGLSLFRSDGMHTGDIDALHGHHLTQSSQGSRLISTAYSQTKRTSSRMSRIVGRQLD